MKMIFDYSLLNPNGDNERNANLVKTDLFKLCLFLHNIGFKGVWIVKNESDGRVILSVFFKIGSGFVISAKVVENSLKDSDSTLIIDIEFESFCLQDEVFTEVTALQRLSIIKIENDNEKRRE